MGLIQEYLQLATDVVSFREYVYDTASAETHNRKVKRMYAIATEIEQNIPDFKNEFCELLFHENREICLWVAHHILEILNCDRPHRKRAMKIIRHKARTVKTAYGFGEKVWLKKWYKAHPKDRWL